MWLQPEAKYSKGKSSYELIAPIFYKSIPKKVCNIGNSKFLLPFQKATLTYYQPRFSFLKVNKDSIMEFCTLYGDITQAMNGIISNDQIKGYHQIKDKVLKLTVTLRYFKDQIYGNEIKNGTVKILNEEIFDNGTWKGGILEAIDVSENNDPQRIGDITFTVASGPVFRLLTVVPKYLSCGLHSDTVYQENIKFLKLCYIPEDLFNKYEK